MKFLDNSFHLARVWLAGLRASFVRDMEFRANFILGMVRQFFWLATFILFVDVMFQRTNAVAGWTQAQVLVLIALSRLVEGLANALFVRNIMRLPGLVRDGYFDVYLLRPVPAQYLTSFRLVDLFNIGNVIGGLFLLGYAVAHLGSSVSLMAWAWFLVMGFLGMVVYYSLLILAASLVFVLERLEALWGFNDLISEPLTVPFDVFPGSVRVILTYLVPVVFIVYVPAQAITNRLAWPTILIAFVVTAILLALSTAAWRAGIRRYSSASS